MSLTGDPLFIVAEQQYRAQAWSVAPRAERPARRRMPTGRWWRLPWLAPAAEIAAPSTACSDAHPGPGTRALAWSVHPIR